MTSSQQVHAGLFGFAVETSARRRAVVEMAPWRLRVFTRGGSPGEVGLSDSKRLIQTISEALGSRAGSMTKVEEVRAAIEYERQRLVARVPREVSLVQERVLAETDQGSGLHTSVAFYARRFLVSDVIRFRAAAVAVGCFGALSRAKLPADAGETARLDLAEDWPAKHCVGSLVGRAARGRAFFFHVDFEGEKATVELDPQGRVVQAAGPRNSDNRAVHWGSRELEECARSGRSKRQKQRVESVGRGDAFDRLRRRLGRFEWLDIAERLHRRAGREK